MKSLFAYTQFRGLKTLGNAKYLSISRYRMRKGFPAAPSASGPLLEEPDWSYVDGTPGPMNVGQTKRYLEDQVMGKTIIKYHQQFKAIEQAKKRKLLENTNQDD